ncbi:FkbM family methyltransferase [Candidatus Peregrinibacteria bacterium]|nr:FkbM family methyltransferase [Candidatus Peregrinibacteria bacterium]
MKKIRKIAKNLNEHIRKKARIKIPFFFDSLFGKTDFPGKYFGVDLIMHADTPYQNHLLRVMREGRYENEIVDDWIEAGKNHKCIIDIGGFNGIFGILAAKVNPEARIFIFEPDSINFRHIQKNIHLNGLNNVKVFQCAVCDKDGELTFGGHLGGTGSRIGFGTTTVKSVSLDEFIKEMNIDPDLLKIDVEGAETMVVEGAKQFLSAKSPMIFLEVHPEFLKSMSSTEEELFRKIESIAHFERKPFHFVRDASYHLLLTKS